MKQIIFKPFKHVGLSLLTLFMLGLGLLALTSDFTNLSRQRLLSFNLSASAQTCTGSPSAVSGPGTPDINADGCVDVQDLSIQYSEWQQTGNLGSELNCQRPVNVSDFGIIMSWWGPYTNSYSHPACLSIGPPPPPSPAPAAPPPPGGSGTTYYVSSSLGNDSNPGTSELEPWQTIAKVEASGFAPGDIIKFRRGDIWREETFRFPSSGTESQPITITNWGDSEEPLPIFTGSWDYGSDASLWSEVSPNIWQTASGSIPRQPGRLWRDGHNNARPLNRETSLSDLDNQWDYWYDSANNLLAIYSLSNPSLAATNIEIPIHARGYIIERAAGSGANYIIWDNLAIYYSRDVNWVTEGTPADPAIGWEIRNSKVAYCGGAALQRGNCIDVHTSGQDIVIDNNEVWEPFDTCISPQNWNPDDLIDNVQITNNNMHHCSSGVEIQTYTPQGSSFDPVSINNVLIAGNSIDCKAGSFAVNINQVGDNGIHLVNHSRGTTKNLTVRNNIIANCASPDFSDGNGIRLLSVGSTQFASDNSGHLIEGNIIFNNQRSAIWLECSGCASRPNTTGVEIRNNFIFNNGESELFIWADWDNTRLLSNTIVDTTADTDALIEARFNDNYEMYNNILSASGQKYLDFTNRKVADYNLYYTTITPAVQFTWAGTDYPNFLAFQAVAEPNGLNTDPLFRDATNLNFNLTSKSPAIDAGLDRQHLFSRDFYDNPKFGSVWDTGAHEWQGLE